MKVSDQGSVRVAGDELLQFVERVERIDAEKKDLGDARREVMAEAKGRGYDTAILNEIVRLRRKDPADISEHEAILELYKSALGMA